MCADVERIPVIRVMVYLFIFKLAADSPPVWSGLQFGDEFEMTNEAQETWKKINK